ncbi:MAG: hypothetical protein ABF296_09470 [Oceanococcaceae bacterium]
MDPIRLLSELTFADPNGDELPRQFEGVAYSGGYISRFGAVIDLTDLRIADGMPLLASHNHEQIIGTVTKAANSGRALTVAGELLSDIEPIAEAMAKKAKRGIKYQMSVGLFDASDELVPAGKSVTINGRTFNGPVTVLRGGHVREVSIVPLGADANTSARFFHESPTPTGGPQMPTVEELTAKVAELEGQLAASADALIAEKAKAQQLSDQIAASAKAQRLEKVEALFAETGREAKDETVAPYLAMSDESFDAVATDMRALRSAVPEHLFASGTPSDPPNPNGPSRLLKAVEERHGLSN